MGVQVYDEQSCIRVVVNGSVLHLHKKLIKTIDTLHDDTVRIDIGEGALKHIYIRFADVTAPVTNDVGALRDVIKAMLDSGDNTQGTTLGNQQTELVLLGDLKGGLGGIQTTLSSVLDTLGLHTLSLKSIKDQGVEQVNLLTQMKNYLQQISSASAASGLSDPLRIDESMPNVVYYGYAGAGASTGQPVWAIKRATRTGNIIVYEWAEGSQLMQFVWDSRYQLSYLPFENA